RATPPLLFSRAAGKRYPSRVGCFAVEGRRQRSYTHKSRVGNESGESGFSQRRPSTSSKGRLRATLSPARSAICRNEEARVDASTSRWRWWQRTLYRECAL